jgi:hypothetical protein
MGAARKGNFEMPYLSMYEPGYVPSGEHAVYRLRHQPEPSLAGREGLRLAQADRPDTPGKAARTAQGELAVRLQLRRAELIQTTKALRPEHGVRPWESGVPQTSEHRLKGHKQPASTGKFLKAQASAYPLIGSARPSLHSCSSRGEMLRRNCLCILCGSDACPVSPGAICISRDQGEIT